MTGGRVRRPWFLISSRRYNCIKVGFLWLVLSAFYFMVVPDNEVMPHWIRQSLGLLGLLVATISFVSYDWLRRHPEYEASRRSQKNAGLPAAPAGQSEVAGPTDASGRPRV